MNGSRISRSEYIWMIRWHNAHLMENHTKDAHYNYTNFKFSRIGSWFVRSHKWKKKKKEKFARQIQVLNIHIFSPIKMQSMLIIRYMNRPFVTWECDEKRRQQRRGGEWKNNKFAVFNWIYKLVKFHVIWHFQHCIITVTFCAFANCKITI